MPVEILKITNVPYCCRISISKRNEVAIQTEKGLEIVILNASTLTSTTYDRVLVTPSSEPSFLKSLNCNYEDLVWQSDAMTFGKLARLPETDAELISNVAITDFTFSPPFKEKCFLALLTLYGAIDIFYRRSLDWQALPHLEFPNRATKNVADGRKKFFEEQPSCLCWTLFNENLVLVVAHKNGDVHLFANSSENSLVFRHLSVVATGVREPCAIGASVESGEILLVIGSYTGILVALTMDDSFKILKSQSLWDTEDFLACSNVKMVKYKGNRYVSASKHTLFLVYKLEGDGTWSEMVKENCSVNIVTISSTTDSFLVCLADSQIIEFSLDTREVRKVLPASGLTSGSVCSSNGSFAVQAVADPSNKMKSHIRFFPLLEDQDKVEQKIIERRALADCFDLVWLYKVFSLKDPTKAISTNNDLIHVPKFKYWRLKQQLQLLDTTSEEGETTFSTLAKELFDLGKELLRSHFQSQPELLNRLDAITGENWSEECPLCKANVAQYNLHSSKCVNQHLLPRCCLTLQLTPRPITICSLCSAYSSLYYEETNGIRCPFCDGTFYQSI